MKIVPLAQVNPNINLSEFISENVRAEMARRRVTQTQLAESLNISRPGLSARLSGKTLWGINELIPVADALGVNVATLIFGYTNTPAPIDAEVLSSPNWIRTSNPSVNGFKQVERHLPLAA